MAKLTRHPSFQDLKAEAPLTRVPAAAREQAHAEFKEFLQLLQHARRQKPSASDDR
jgi:hypothetical protein